MSTQFQINFRREAFRRERTEARRRAVGLGIWLTYFGMLGVMIGLYGLNCASLENRTQQHARQLAHQRALRAGGNEWIASASEVAAVEPWVSDAARWRDLLGALPRLLPEGARLTSIQFNPDGVTGGERKLLLSGVMRVDSRLDRTAGVTDFVAVIARDSLFAAQFHSVRLVATRAREAGVSGAAGSEAEFEVECR